MTCDQCLDGRHHRCHDLSCSCGMCAQRRRQRAPRRTRVASAIIAPRRTTIPENVLPKARVVTASQAERRRQYEKAWRARKREEAQAKRAVLHEGEVVTLTEEEFEAILAEAKRITEERMSTA